MSTEAKLLIDKVIAENVVIIEKQLGKLEFRAVMEEPEHKAVANFVERLINEELSTDDQRAIHVGALTCDKDDGFDYGPYRIYINEASNLEFKEPRGGITEAFGVHASWG